jgi:hypothetical protein
MLPSIIKDGDEGEGRSCRSPCSTPLPSLGATSRWEGGQGTTNTWWPDPTLPGSVVEPLCSANEGEGWSYVGAPPPRRHLLLVWPPTGKEPRRRWKEGGGPPPGRRATAVSRCCLPPWGRRPPHRRKRSKEANRKAEGATDPRGGGRGRSICGG